MSQLVTSHWLWFDFSIVDTSGLPGYGLTWVRIGQVISWLDTSTLYISVHRHIYYMSMIWFTNFTVLCFFLILVLQNVYLTQYYSYSDERWIALQYTGLHSETLSFKLFLSKVCIALKNSLDLLYCINWILSTVHLDL